MSWRCRPLRELTRRWPGCCTSHIKDKKTWRVQQVLVDPDEHNDWMAEFEIDIAASRAAEEPVLQLRSIGAITR